MLPIHEEDKKRKAAKRQSIMVYVLNVENMMLLDTIEFPTRRAVIDTITAIATTKADDLSYEQCYRSVWYYCTHHNAPTQVVVNDVLYRIVPQVFCPLVLQGKLYEGRTLQETIALLFDVLLFPCRYEGMTLSHFQSFLRKMILREWCPGRSLLHKMFHRQINGYC